MTWGDSSGYQSVSLPGRELSQLQDVGEPSNRAGLTQDLFIHFYLSVGPYTMGSGSLTLSLSSADLSPCSTGLCDCQALMSSCAQGLWGIGRDMARKQPRGLVPDLIAENPSFWR